ncbi:MAG: DUF58 domain-containing protein [Hyphomicrobium sp.]
MTDGQDRPDIPYRLPWRHARAGVHRSKLEGSGGFFRDVVPLVRSPDPRRLDLRISARDPFGGLHVRRFEHKAAVTVYVLVDVSASMGFCGSTDKFALAAGPVRRAGGLGPTVGGCIRSHWMRRKCPTGADVSRQPCAGQ